VDAKNNWWGTAVESEIQAKIYDWFDDSTKGFVDYNPWSPTIRTDAPISPPTGFTATAGVNSIILNWSPNPEADLAGYRVYYGANSGYPYANVVDVGNVTNYTINGITAGTYYVAVTAYDMTYNPANDDPNTIVNENQTNGNESWFSQEQMVTDLVLYDDFSGAYIDKNKWREREFVREIKDGKLISKTTAYGSRVTNNLNFSNPASINNIEADVTINEIEGDFGSSGILNYSSPNARITGFFYNDGSATGPGSYKGEVQAAIRISPYNGMYWVYWFIWKLTNDEGTDWTTLAWNWFPYPVSPNTTYKLSVQFEPDSKTFTFKVGDTVKTWTSTDPTHPSNIPWKAIGTDVYFTGTGTKLYGKISAQFDNICVNSELYDDFSSPMIDQTKWITYEFVREIQGEKLRSRVRTSAASSSSIYNRLEFINPSLINIIQAKVTPIVYGNSLGADTVARISGYYYNDGTSGGTRIGQVGAQVRIGGTGSTPVASWLVWKETDETGNAPVELASGIFTTPVMLGNTYTLFLGWDGSRFTFRVDDEVAYYSPTTSINASKIQSKEIGTRIWNPSSKEAIIEALFDDVMVNRFHHIVIKPSSLNFGNVQVGNSADQTITLSNSGTETLEITSVVGPNTPFSIVGGTCPNPPFTLNPWGSCEVVLRFSPSTASLFSDSITINSNDPDEPAVTISLEGTGTSGLPCDCNSDGQTTIDEVQKSINCFLGISSQPCCDLNENGQCTIDEVQRCINAFLGL